MATSKFTVPPEGNPDRDKRLMALLASRVKNNRHLRKILLDAKPDMREAVYHELVPHLLFEAKPFAEFKLKTPTAAHA